MKSIGLILALLIAFSSVIGYAAPSEPNPDGPPAINLPSRFILGAPVLDKDSVVGFIINQGSTLSREYIEEIIWTYIVEAKREGINHDIAIALMLKATNFLDHPRILRTHNYGDLRRIQNRETMFPTIELGIRAHIQQLKVHVSYDKPSVPIVDRPRYNHIKASTNRRLARTLDELFPVWETKYHEQYRNEINTILGELYYYQWSSH